jgi:peptidoglycan/xylan/chitin deacetylase (PgdA/CDA1 family)
MRYFHERYDIVTLEELITKVQRPEKSNRNMVVITFDDAYREVYDNVYPILKKYKCPATVFCPAEVLLDEDNFCPIWVDRLIYILDRSQVGNIILPKNSSTYRLKTSSQKRKALLSLINILRSLNKDERENYLFELADQLRVNLSYETFYNKYLTVKQIKEMQKHGISFGAHTMSHPDLGQITRKEAKKEIEQSKIVIENITGEECKFFAYPFGESYLIDNYYIEMLKQIGFIGAVTTIDGINYSGDNPYKLKRVLASGHDFQIFALRCSGVSALLKGFVGKT